MAETFGRLQSRPSKLLSQQIQANSTVQNIWYSYILCDSVCCCTDLSTYSRFFFSSQRFLRDCLASMSPKQTSVLPNWVGETYWNWTLPYNNWYKTIWIPSGALFRNAILFSLFLWTSCRYSLQVPTCSLCTFRCLRTPNPCSSRSNLWVVSNHTAFTRQLTSFSSVMIFIDEEPYRSFNGDDALLDEFKQGVYNNRLTVRERQLNF